MVTNLLDSYNRAVKIYHSALNYREWLGSKGYNVKCEHFTVSCLGGISCDLQKPLILCGGRCRHKTNK